MQNVKPLAEQIRPLAEVAKTRTMGIFGTMTVARLGLLQAHLSGIEVFAEIQVLSESPAELAIKAHDQREAARDALKEATWLLKRMA